MRLLYGDVSHVHRDDAYYINISDGNVRIRARALELLVLGESLLSREIIGGLAVPNGVLYSLCDDRIFHHVATIGNGAFSYVFKYMYTDIVSRTIYRSADRSSNERGDWGIYRTRDVGPDRPILRLLHQFQRHSKIFEVPPVRELREVWFRRRHDLRVRLQSGEAQVFRVLLPL